MSDFLQKVSERLATVADIPIILQIEQSAFPQPRWASEDTLLRRMCLYPNGTWLGLFAGRPVGFSNGFPIRDLKTQEELDPPDPTLFDPEGTVWLLRNVAVRKEHQRQGLGKFLIQRQLKLAREFGARHFRFAATTDLNDYYSEQGFKKIREEEKFHGLPQGVWDMTL